MEVCNRGDWPLLLATVMSEIEFSGKPRIFYSREDLSVGLAGQPVEGT